MKHIILITCALIASVTLVAQDIIVTRDAQKIEAKITEVSKSEIKYKDWDNQDGPTFILEVTDISSIIYSNGKVTVFNQEKAADEPQKTAQEKTESVIVDFEIMRMNNSQMYKFVNHSSGATDFRWDFGDGTWGYAPDYALHEYEKLGTYTVTLTATVGGNKYEQRKTITLGNQQQEDDFDVSSEMLQESLDNLGNAINNLRQTVNSYGLVVHNTTKYPYKINLDGHILGVVAGYKTETYLVPLEWYGRLQAVQTDGYMIYPTVKEFKISPQKKHANISIKL